VAVIQVADTGVGMDPEIRERAFEPFFTTKGAGRGNGLGLAMVDSFVKQSGGEISITSAPGKGTTVTMVLPAEAHDFEPDQEAENAATILLIEDEPKIRRIVALQLSRAGYVVEEVASAEEALQLIEAGLQPTVVLSDVRLREGMSGADLVLELRRRKCPAVPVFVTGFAEELDWYGKELKDVPVLRKPFRHIELLMEVEKAILSASR
jgi:CheY-like chemotaxis protein